MQKTKFVKFMQSVVVLPVFASTLVTAPLTGLIAGSPTAAAIFPETNAPLSSELTVNLQKQEQLEKAAKIDAYFAKYDLPMEGYGLQLVTAAEENDLPPYLLASIAFNESTACKFMIKKTNNCFGWGGGKIHFESIDQAIDTIGDHLGGNNPKTARYYEGKSIPEVLVAYNGKGPDGRTVNPQYVKKIYMVMDKIEKVQVQQPIAAQSIEKNA